MELTSRNIIIKGLEWGETTHIENGVLYVNKKEALLACGEYSNIDGIDLHIARPGENVRIIPVKAAVEPRCKIGNEGAIFPGIVGPMKQAGTGITLALKGTAVLVTESNDTEVRCRTGAILDMSGPIVAYTPLSQTYNLIVDVRVSKEVMSNETLSTDEVCRIAGFKLAVYLAECCKDSVADSEKIYTLADVSEDLPGVVYVMQLLAQNPEIIDFHVYGQLAGTTFIPTYVHPNEIYDGSVTTFLGAHCTVSADKQYMYEIQNSPVIEELYKLHGKEIKFLGVVVHNEVTTLKGKERASLFVKNISKALGAKGAILVTEGHGNPDEDIMMNVRNLENAGIRTVIISDELGGRDGRSPGLADWVPECNAMVSVGNMHELLAVPKTTDIFIGNANSMEIVTAVVDKAPTDEDLFFIEIKDIPLACAQAGISNLSARWI